MMSIKVFIIGVQGQSPFRPWFLAIFYRVYI